MKGLLALIRRNVKIFFKDLREVFSSLITPVILLVLYGTFLGRVYRENFLLAMPAGVHIPESLLNGLVGGQLISSILAVSCVTVAFCSNMLMVQDKVSGARADLMVTPGPAVCFGHGLLRCVSAGYVTGLPGCSWSLPHLPVPCGLVPQHLGCVADAVGCVFAGHVWDGVIFHCQ